MKRTKGCGTFLIVSGLLMIVAAVALFSYNIWDNMRVQAVTEDVTARLDEVIYSRMNENDIHDETEPEQSFETREEAEEDLYRDMPTITIDGYDYIGKLTIPALEIELPVMEEWDYTRMKIAVCRYSGTVYLKNMVICGHNYQPHFQKLDKLQDDDLIIFTDADGNTYKYKVAQIEVLVPSAVEEMKTGEWDLTLFTCNYSGRARVAVRCDEAVS